MPPGAAARPGEGGFPVCSVNCNLYGVSNGPKISNLFGRRSHNRACSAAANHARPEDSGPVGL